MTEDPVDRLVGWLDARDGIARTESLYEAGFSAALIRVAEAGSRVRRIRRSWISTVRCDDRRATAASITGRVSCLSAAEMAGLWVPGLPGAHFAVDPGSSRIALEDATVHWARGPVPLTKRELIDAPLNVLFHVARCQSLADALAIWESAIRKGYADPAVLRRTRWGSRSAQKIARIADSLSDSGLESRLRWLLMRAGITIRQQVWIDGHPVDALIGELLVVQVDGFEFHRAGDRRRDLEADARLVLRGYTVLRFDYQQVFFNPDHVVETVRLALAQRRHLPS